MPKIYRDPTIDDHHTVIGERRGFQVRLYHEPSWEEPYLISLFSLRSSLNVDGVTVFTEAEAQAEASAMLAGLEDGTLPRKMLELPIVSLADALAYLADPDKAGDRSKDK